MGNTTSAVLDNIVQGSNCTACSVLLYLSGYSVADRRFCGGIVDREEVDRLRKRFMKLDKVRCLQAGNDCRRKADKVL
jgi:hypothetical protein